jgi:hypothetical protein
VYDDINFGNNATNKDTGYFIKFSPKLNITKLRIPEYSNYGHPDCQAYHSFINVTGSIGYTQGGIAAYIHDNKYKITSNGNEIWNNHVYSIINSKENQDCFYLIAALQYFQSDQIGLCVNKICLDGTDNIGVNQTYQYDYDFGDDRPGLLLSNPQDKSLYLHQFSKDDKLSIFRFNNITGRLEQEYIANTGDSFPKLWYHSGPQMQIPSSNATGTRVLLNFEDLDPSHKGPGNDKIYFYKIHRGRDWEFLDTLDFSTFDPKAHLGIFQARFSPSGRYVYGASQNYFRNNDINMFYDTLRLIRVDVAGVGTPGYKPKIEILQQWTQEISLDSPRYITELSIQSFAPDGHIYFQVRDRCVGDDLPSRISTLFRLRNPDQPYISWQKNVDTIMENIPYMTYYYRNDNIDPETWAAFPYHTTSDSVCLGLPNHFIFTSSIPYDSLQWQDSSGHILARAIFPDSTAQYSFTSSGSHRIVCHVFWHGGEDIVCTNAYSFSAASLDSLRTLPRRLIVCEGDTLTVSPAPDPLAVVGKWQDGYPYNDRKITHSDTLIWEVYYKNFKCPRLDTLIITYPDWDKVYFPDTSFCGDHLLLSPSGINASCKITWDNGDTFRSRLVTKSGTYCFTLNDTLRNCSKEFCSSVTLDKYRSPSWANLDTVICPREKIYLHLDAGYRININGSYYTGPDEIILTDSGIIDAAITYKSCPEEKTSLHIAFKDEDSCSNECMWTMPNIFNPASLIEVNRTFGPVTSCHQATYTLTIYNRWGEQVYKGQEPWNGMFGNYLCPDGVYFYILDCLDDYNGSRRIKGNVTLLK